MKQYNERSGMDLNTKVLNLLNEAVDNKEIPGAVIQINHNEEIILKKAVGHRINYNGYQKEMEIDTIFDLASLTKVVSTLPSILKLLDDGKITLKDPVYSYIPAFKNNRKEAIQIIHLLTHTSGLSSFHTFYKENLNRDEILQKIYEDSLEYEPGTKVIYSDLGYILLSIIVEIVSNQPFNEFVETNIFKPLNMTETHFRPDYEENRFAATEYYEELKTFKLGTVHDENADCLGGVSGHAGLFSTVTDLDKYISMFQKEGMYNNNRILSEQSIRLSRENHTFFAKDRRGLGWNLKGPDASCGKYCSTQTYGHTGFTGTSIWVDPEINLSIILLTNRVHFGRDVSIGHLRSKVHNIIRKNI